MAVSQPVEVNDTTLVSTYSYVLRGFSFRGEETSLVVLRNGEDSSAGGLVYIDLLEGQSAIESFGDGIDFAKGLYVEVVSGTIAGSVWGE